MKAVEIKELSVADLQERRDIARMMTILHEKMNK